MVKFYLFWIKHILAQIISPKNVEDIFFILRTHFLVGI